MPFRLFEMEPSIVSNLLHFLWFLCALQARPCVLIPLPSTKEKFFPYILSPLPNAKETFFPSDRSSVFVLVSHEWNPWKVNWYRIWTRLLSSVLTESFTCKQDSPSYFRDEHNQIILGLDLVASLRTPKGEISECQQTLFSWWDLPPTGVVSRPLNWHSFS